MKTLCLAANDSSRRLVDALALPSTITFIIDTLLTPGFPYTDDGLVSLQLLSRIFIGSNPFSCRLQSPNLRKNH